MKLKNIEQVNDFLKAVEEAKGQVIIKSCVPGNEIVLNLKSKLSQYVAMGALLGEYGENFELFCDNRDDERLFLNFFYEHPEV